LKKWLKAGKTVELCERGQRVARILPACPVENRTVAKRSKHKPVEWPDFEAQANEIFGDRVFPNAVIEERKRARY
jgi:antitoxin (DNA-binding transcriptional repressor) of toxin-antitoxin stability system